MRVRGWCTIVLLVCAVVVCIMHGCVCMGLTKRFVHLYTVGLVYGKCVIICVAFE